MSGPEEIYHIVDNQESVMVSMAEIDGDGRVLLVMSKFGICKKCTLLSMSHLPSLRTCRNFRQVELSSNSSSS